MVAVRWCCSRVALAFTPQVISVLAPGFNDDPGRFALATELTRITFPVSSAGVAGDALWRHPELDPSLCDAGGGADPAQSRR